MPRRPLATLPRISCDDACHKRRGSLGGTDYVVPVGTPVYAMFSGLARFRVAGTGGWTISINRDVNHQVGETMHMSKANGFVLGGASRPVTEGDLIGWSGGAVRAPGAGSSTGPHLHAHVYVNGVRYGMEEYLANPSWAGGGLVKIIAEQDDDMSNMLLYINDGEGRYGAKGGNHYALFTARGTFPITRDAFASALTWAFGEKNTDGTPSKNAYNCTYEEWEMFHTPMSSGAPSDNGPVLAAVAGVSAQITAFPVGASKTEVESSADRVIAAVPTANQNGAASRDHIVRPT